MNQLANPVLALLPGELRELLSTWRFEANTLGRSSSRVYRVSSQLGAEAAYLKIQPITEDDNLQQEREALLWLQGRLPVPQLLHFSQDDDMQYMLISEISGLTAADDKCVAQGLDAAMRVARLLGRGLRMVHAVDITNCPLKRPLEAVLAEAERRVASGLVDTEDLQPENCGRSPQDILEQLTNTRPSADELVFTHGDYCLPNIILRGEAVSGFIDWGRAGIADRYADIALMVRSLKYNLGSEYGPALTEVFLQAYGLEKADEAKIAYYVLLDELF